jgi:thioredoxin reductase
MLDHVDTCGCRAGYVQVTDLPVSGLFFAIGHEPATKFLDGQLKLDSEKYVVTEPGAADWRACKHGWRVK